MLMVELLTPVSVAPVAWPLPQGEDDGEAQQSREDRLQQEDGRRRAPPCHEDPEQDQQCYPGHGRGTGPDAVLDRRQRDAVADQEIEIILQQQDAERGMYLARRRAVEDQIDRHRRHPAEEGEDAHWRRKDRQR